MGMMSTAGIRGVCNQVDFSGCLEDPPCLILFILIFSDKMDEEKFQIYIYHLPNIQNLYFLQFYNSF